MVHFRFSTTNFRPLMLRIGYLSFVTIVLAVVLLLQNKIKDHPEDYISTTTTTTTTTQQVQHRRQLLRIYDPRSIVHKAFFQQGSVVAVINTPKCGTDTLANAFVNSFQCGTNYRNIGQVLQFDCPEQVKVLRTHDFEEGIERLIDAKSLHPDRKCMIVTAIRNPQMWLASLYMQTGEGYSLCNEDGITREDFVQKYKDWIVHSSKNIHHAITSIRPPLLNEFGAQSLADEFIKMNTNKGYSILNHPSEASSPAATNNPFTNCQLLFLRMEDSDRWPQILANFIPEHSVQHSPARADRCPAIASHYHAIKTYKLTEDEKSLLIGDSADAAEYFQVYSM